MEEETQTQPNTGDNISSRRRPWSFETNWTISGGSLDASVTVESFDLPVQSDNDFPVQSDNSTPKPLLVLQPSSSGSEPCEIKISFTQKHEIRQVYVRSTARVYEIYYASSVQSEDEYLCTVRCSIADKKDDLLHTSDIGGASTGEPTEVKMVGGSNTSSPREDDWVEVKIPAATRSSRDFYEATAEMSDVDPCMSITLRLLSLQSKGCVYVDEVYVFADTIESADSEHQAVELGNSTGTNLMAMLVPTLLQLTKSRVSGLDDKRASSSMEKQEYLEIDLGKSSSTNTAGEIQHVGSHNSQLETNVKLQNHFQDPAEAPKNEKSDNISKNDNSSIQLERVMEQLVSRMSRIEDIFLRFEDNMVKPINSMLERLERVEQQVEVLAKNSQCPKLQSGTIFTAPDFSYDSNSNSSSFNEGNSTQSCGPSEMGKKNITTTTPDISSQPDDDKSRFLPSLMVTAPEFSCCEDEEENIVLEPRKGISQEKEKPKQTLSIDDALAAALAGFSSTTLVQIPNDRESFTTKTPKFAKEENDDWLLEYSESLSGATDNDEHVVFKVSAPEFNGEEKGIEEKVSEPDHQKGKPLGPGSCRIEEITSENPSISTSTHDGSSIETANIQISNLVSVHLEGTSEVTDCPSTDKDDFGLTEGFTEPEKSNLTSKISVSDDIPDIANTGSVFDKKISSVITRTSYPSRIDFESPILEVKFASRDISSANSTLEALLTDDAETYVKAPQQENNDNLISQEMNFENGEATSSGGWNCLLVELDGYDVEDVTINMAGDGIQDHQTCINQVAFASLI